MGHYIASDLSKGCNNEVAALQSDHYTADIFRALTEDV